jgi:protein-S-isoprenylcysteine O-methyltransferase Ste14
MARDPDTAKIVMFPPVLVGGAMVLGFVLDWLYPIPLLSPGLAHGLSGLLALFSIMLAFSAQRVMSRAGTSVRPDRPTTAVVTDGPYRWTRNPIYIAELGIYVAVALWINGLAPVILFPVLVVALDWGVVRREEAYLSEKFGEPYRTYLTQVRRWI